MQTLFAGGRVFDGENPSADGLGVLIEGARVRRVAPLAEFDGFAGQRVDTAGATLMPGLADCHVHLMMGGEPDPIAARTKVSSGALVLKGLERAQAALCGGMTMLRDCGGIDYLEFAVRDALNAGRFAGPTVRAAGRMICMTGGHGNIIARVADGVDEVVKAVREQIHAGSDLIKIMATGGVMTPGVDPEDAHYSAEEMAAGIGEGHRFHRKCASHAQGAEGILNAVVGGVDSIEHGIFMDERCITEMIERGTVLVPTLSAIRNILAHRDHGIPAYMVEKCDRVTARHVESLRRFYEAGGRIAMGTDAGTPFNLHGENALELAYMVEAGMAPLDALRSATRIGADLIGLDDKGRVAEGAAADFLIVEGDPTADIARAAEKRHHRAVVKDGALAAGDFGGHAETDRAAE
ncbi:MAG: amidohydrolase family protein [Alphaproteobacteria bacterium]